MTTLLTLILTLTRIVGGDPDARARKPRWLFATVAALITGGSFAQTAVLPPEPTWVDVGSWYPPSAMYGQVKGYVRVPVSTDSGNVNVLMTLTPQESDDVVRMMLAQQGRLPPSTQVPTYGGPYNFTISSDTGAKTYTATGATLAEFRQSMAMCPSDVCSQSYVSGSAGTFYGTTVGSPAYSTAVENLYGYFRNMDMVQVSYAPKFIQGKFYIQVQLAMPNSYTTWINATVDSVTCKQGYSLNTTSGQCDLKNVTEASVAVGDGVCLVYGGFPVMSDPDCAAAAAVNKLTTSTASDGSPVTSVATPTKGTMSSVYRPATQTTTISTVSPTADGGTKRDDTEISSTGAIGPTSTTQYPANPPPLYPGDSGGTIVPGSPTGTTQTAAPLASDEQLKRMNDTLDKINKNLGGDGAGDGTGDDTDGPLADVGDGLPGDVTEKLDGLKEKASMLPVTASCPANMFSFTLPMPARLGGDYFLSDRGLVCNTLGEYQDLIRMVSIACGFIAATFIVLRA